MKQIPITGGVVKVDDQDYERVLSMGRWHVNRHGYATKKNKKLGVLLMHRFILDYSGLLYTDHINGDRLDNTRMNLRLVPGWVNNLNRHKKSKSKSGFCGIRKNHCGRWTARVGVNGGFLNLGSFDTLNKAIAARQEAIGKFLADPTTYHRLREHRANNRSGTVGVYFSTRMRRWRAKYNSNHLGTYLTKEQAIAARKQAESRPFATPLALKPSSCGRPSWGAAKDPL